jgi:FkbM family methyltransferase
MSQQTQIHQKTKGIFMHRQNKQRKGFKGQPTRIRSLEISKVLFQKALTCFNSGQFREAEDLLETHLQQYPKDDAALNLSALIDYEYRNFNSAIEKLRSAIQLNDHEHRYHNNLGAAMKESGDIKGSIPCFHKAVDLYPDYCDAAYNLGSSYQAMGDLSLALTWYDYTLARDPEYHLAWNNKACTYKDQGKIKEALEVFQETFRRKLNTDRYDSNFLFCLNYLEDIDPETVFRHHLEWSARHVPDFEYSQRNYPNDAVPNRRLRVGYVSADFRSHSVAFFMNPILIAHNREKFDIYCYADVALPDEITQTMMTNAEHWSNIHGMTDDMVFQCIQKDSIDILVDLGGHSGNNRMRLFARKPAPIQVSYLGYPNTTGLKAIDYRITDAIADPPGMTDRFYTEKLIRLPDGFLCYQSSVGCPDVTPSPCLENGYITFGSFNNRPKINATVIAVWSDILLRVPDSKLILKSSLALDMDARQELCSLFVENGINASRIQILPYLLFTEHLAQYQQIDIALDTFPYNGTTTTCEALWMGVPVLTLVGNVHAARVGASILGHLGLSEWIVSSIDDYVSASVKLSADIGKLKQLRWSLRERFKNSSLMDKNRFTAKLEAAYRLMWFERCARLVDENGDRRDIKEVRIPGEITVCIPNDASCPISYILMEQQDWFEREITFFRTFLQPGMNGVDIGANCGMYALTAAKHVGPVGQVWAFEPSRLTAAYLARSARIDELNNITVNQAGVSDSERSAFLSANTLSGLNSVIEFEGSDIKESTSLVSLDGWMQSRSADINFLTMNGLGQENNIINGGKRFFETFSPLILYKIKLGDRFHLDSVQAFSRIGYQSYRLVPGLNILAPFTIGEKVDIFQLNLFCCKAYCAEKLRKRGLLVSTIEKSLSLIDAPAHLWLDYFQNFPYVLRLLRMWETFCVEHADDLNWQKHQQALSAYAISKLPGYSGADRYTALAKAHELMSDIVTIQPTVSRVMTSIRIAHDLGCQEDAANMLYRLYEYFESGKNISLDEPFLAVSGRIAALDPGNDMGQWLIYGVLESRELYRTFSSYFVGKSSLPDLELMRSSPFYSDEMERRRQLIRDRFGIKGEGG